MRTDNTEYIVEKCESMFKDDHLDCRKEAWICESKDVARFRIEENAKLFGYFLDFDWIYDTIYFAKAETPDGAKISVAYKIHVIGDGFDGEPYIHLKDAKRIFENAAWGYSPSHGSNRPATDDEVELWEHAAKQIAGLSRREKLNAKKRVIDLDAAKQVVKNAIWRNVVPYGLDRMPTDEETDLWLFTLRESKRYIRKEEEADMAENNDRQPRKIRCSSSIGVVRETFEEVLDVLSKWHEKGYRLRSVEWNSDTQRYTIQGSQDVWIYE